MKQTFDRLVDDLMDSGFFLEEAVEILERTLITRTLERTGGNRSAASKLLGIRTQRVTGPQYENGRDTIVVDDTNAPPLWARFYDLETGKPFFCSRDGIKRATLGEISRERRNGYAWYGNWGNRVLTDYPKWKARIAKN